MRMRYTHVLNVKCKRQPNNVQHNKNPERDNNDRRWRRRRRQPHQKKKQNETQEEDGEYNNNNNAKKEKRKTQTKLMQYYLKWKRVNLQNVIVKMGSFPRARACSLFLIHSIRLNFFSTVFFHLFGSFFVQNVFSVLFYYLNMLTLMS